MAARSNNYIPLKDEKKKKKEEKNKRKADIGRLQIDYDSGFYSVNDGKILNALEWEGNILVLGTMS